MRNSKNIKVLHVSDNLMFWSILYHTMYSSKFSLFYTTGFEEFSRFFFNTWSVEHQNFSNLCSVTNLCSSVKSKQLWYIYLFLNAFMCFMAPKQQDQNSSLGPSKQIIFFNVNLRFTANGEKQYSEWRCLLWSVAVRATIL